MGILDFSSKSTSKNYATDNRAIGDGGSTVATGEAQITINQESGQSLDLATDALAGAFRAVDQTNAAAVSIANRAFSTEEGPTEQFIRQAVPVAIVGLIIWGLFK